MTGGMFAGGTRLSLILGDSTGVLLLRHSRFGDSPVGAGGVSNGCHGEDQFQCGVVFALALLIEMEDGALVVEGCK